MRDNPPPPPPSPFRFLYPHHFQAHITREMTDIIKCSLRATKEYRLSWHRLSCLYRNGMRRKQYSIST